MEKIVIRPSSLATYVNCPYKWYLMVVEKQPVIPKPIMVAGTAVHKGAEVGYREKIDTGKLPPVSVMKDAAVQEFQEKIKEAATEGEDINKYEKIVVEDIDLYQPKMEKVEPKAVEEHFRVEFDSKYVEALEGTADIILNRGIADIKTTNRKAVPSNYTLQLSAYALLFEKNKNKEITFAEIHNIVNGKEALILPAPLSKQQVKFIINNLIDTIELMYEKDIKPEILFKGNPKSYLCSELYCDNYKTCPFVRGLL